MNREQVCPHCGAQMNPVRTPSDSSWGGELHHVCFNDECCYFTESWDSLRGQGIKQTGYRCRMDPRGHCGPAPVWSQDALKDLIVPEGKDELGSEDHFSAEDLSRDDESPDGEFYDTPRFVDHLDKTALETVESVYRRLISPGSRILDLMAGPDSHLDAVTEPARVTGLGLNEEELSANSALSDYRVHDLNSDRDLPFPDGEFDVVVNTVSVDYMTGPIEVFREVARVLKPGGLFIVVFSNRLFPPKAVKLWQTLNERQRVNLVRRYFSLSERFCIEGYYESTGKPRPEDDKYYGEGIPSDPVYVVWGTTMKTGALKSA